MKNQMLLKVETVENVEKKTVKMFGINLPFSVGDAIRYSCNGGATDFIVQRIVSYVERHEGYSSAMVRVCSASGGYEFWGSEFLYGDRKKYEADAAKLSDALKNVKVLTSVKK